MAESEPTVEFNGDFSEPGAQAVPWPEVARVLQDSEMFWLSTVRADGRPHVTPLPAVWHGGALHFCTSEPEQKTRNLEHEPRVVLTTGTNQMRSGLDVVVEGTAEPVTDPDRLTELAALWKSKLDWDFGVREGGFTDEQGTAGLVFAVRPAKVLSFGKAPYSQTRYRF
jgi:general stress protein 26